MTLYWSLRGKLVSFACLQSRESQRDGGLGGVVVHSWVRYSMVKTKSGQPKRATPYQKKPKNLLMFYIMKQIKNSHSHIWIFALAKSLWHHGCCRPSAEARKIVASVSRFERAVKVDENGYMLECRAHDLIQVIVHPHNPEVSVLGIAHFFPHCHHASWTKIRLNGQTVTPVQPTQPLSNMPWMPWGVRSELRCSLNCCWSSSLNIWLCKPLLLTRAACKHCDLLIQLTAKS